MHAVELMGLGVPLFDALREFMTPPRAAQSTHWVRRTTGQEEMNKGR